MTLDCTQTTDVMTPKEVAELLRIRPRTVYELVKRNDIPYFFVGKLLRFSREAILAHLHNQEAAQ